MDTRVLRTVAVFTVAFLLLSSPLSSQSQGGTNKPSVEQTLSPQACTDWNLASDFRRSPNQENPNRDSCGTLGVWHFMMSADLNRDPQTYSLLPYFASSSGGIQGLEKWSGPEHLPPPDGIPEFAINTTGVDQYVPYVFPPNVIDAHPGITRLAIAGWRSPISGTVRITGFVNDLNPGCGDGILWYIDKGTANLAAGSIASGGSQEFRDGTGGDNLAEVAVNQGDFVYFGIHPGDDFYCDSTELDISIHLLPYLLATKAVSPTTASRGSPLTYTIELQNGSTISLTNALVTDTLPSTLAYIGNSLTATSGSTGYTNGVITWTGSVNASRAETITFGAIASPPVLGTVITNSAVISGGGRILTRTAIVHIPPAYVFLPLCTRNYCPDFSDDFSNPASGWEVGDDAYARAEYLNGEYRILTKRSGYTYLFRAPTCNRQNYIVEADARWAGTPGVGYSLVFGIAGDFSQYYLFPVNTDYQQYWLVRRDPGVWVTLVGATHSPAIHSGTASNHLRVTRSGSQITLEVNGTALGTWDDSAISGLTGVGLASSPYSDLPTSDVRFDNFRITNLGSAAIQQGSINTDTKAESSQIIPHGFPRVVTFDSQ